jgi:hypothetical protein
MNIILWLFMIGVVAIIAGFLIAVEFMGRLAERHAQAHADRYAPRHDITAVPRQMPLDPFSWAATEAIVHAEHERLATTGELRKLYERPYPLAAELYDAGLMQLGAIAEAGDLDALREINAAWAADNLTGEEA